MKQEELYGHPFTRRMWTDLDHILLIYVGSAAEFPLVEENHWLFYTDKLPSAPWDRFTSTFAWNRKIMLTPKKASEDLAQKIRGFHTAVESQRSEDEGGQRRISNDAYLAVGYMLIEYSLLANAYLERREVSDEEKEIYYQDQRGFFEGMGIEHLPKTYVDYRLDREKQMREQLKPNDYTEQLFEAYRKDLGGFRYWIMCQFMACFVPEPVLGQLNLKASWMFKGLYRLFPYVRCRPVSGLLHLLLLPKRVRKSLG